MISRTSNSISLCIKSQQKKHYILLWVFLLYEGRFTLFRSGRVVTSSVLIGLLLLIPLSTPLVGANEPPINVGEGPYVDRVEYKHIIMPDSQAYALLNNEIDNGFLFMHQALKEDKITH